MTKATRGPSSGTATGGIVIETGSSVGMIEGCEVTLCRARSATVLASRTGASGTLKWEKGPANISGNIALEASALAEVKDSSISSTTRILIFAPPSGSCDGSLPAPVVQVCPAF